MKFYVVRIDQKPHLSGKACKQLGIVERIQMMSENTTGTLPGTYSIKIDPTIPPIVHGPRIVDKLKEMESQGHIAKVSEPTGWASSMVTVVKN